MKANNVRMGHVVSSGREGDAVPDGTLDCFQQFTQHSRAGLATWRPCGTEMHVATILRGARSYPQEFPHLSRAGLATWRPCGTEMYVATILEGTRSYPQEFTRHLRA